MKKLITTFTLLLITLSVNAQLSTGLVANWRFKGNALDSTGNGHNGTQNNITYGVGRNGKPNTAAIFNGTSSYITTSYKSDLNLTSYSLCAIIKPIGFYSNTCQTNAILWHGYQLGPTNYSLFYFDNPLDGNSCAIFDNTKEVFASLEGNSTVNVTSFGYAPTIKLNTWYVVVATYANDTIRIYVNDTLKSTTVCSTGGITAGTDSLWIGANGYLLASYPYWLNAYVDDLRIYNRVLNAAEIKQYNGIDTVVTSTGIINANEIDVNIYPNPASNHIIINGETNTTAPILLDITNCFGQEVYSEMIDSKSTYLNKDIDTRSYSKGIYFVRLRTENENKTIKLLIQ